MLQGQNSEEDMRGGLDREVEQKARHAVYVFLGLNNQSQNLGEGLRLARGCQHELAQWLVRAFPGGPPATKKEARERLLKLGEDMAPRGRALCLAGLVGAANIALLRRAAERGDALAMGWMGSRAIGSEALAFAEKSAAQGDPLGLFAAAMLRGRGSVPMDDEDTRRLLRAAAEGGWVAAMYEYGWRCGASGERYRWWGRAAAEGMECAGRRMQEEAPEQLALWQKDPTARALVVWQLGAALRGRVQGDCAQARAAAACVKLVDGWTSSAREALWCWMSVARRLRVVKDVARLIARMCWQDRSLWST